MPSAMTAVPAISRGLIFAAFLLLLSAMQPAYAEAERYNGVLLGKNLTPQVESNGLGSVQLAVAGDQLSWAVSFYDLQSLPVAVHVNGPAGPGENAPLLLDLGKDWGDLGRNNIMTGTLLLSQDQLASLASGKWYLVVCTQAHPEGELRAQLERFN
ncbi:MAG: CHRD domain-containing protein [Alphaproteobacteria bacterium]|nr:CHRD domain-containing protein [Alphaproteobacteria bacterium]